MIWGQGACFYGGMGVKKVVLVGEFVAKGLAIGQNRVFYVQQERVDGLC